MYITDGTFARIAMFYAIKAILIADIILYIDTIRERGAEYKAFSEKTIKKEKSHEGPKKIWRAGSSRLCVW